MPSHQWFGHPRALATLFFTEMWERFSYYGMRAILVLALTDAIAHGGQGLTDAEATALYGLYTSGIYVLSLAGGWCADRVLGTQRAVFLGGIVIALGHCSMALPYTTSFYLGMVFIALGSGLFKPSISTLVGSLYHDASAARRDAGFSIFYMGINLGALIGQVVCGYLGERVGWHYGFGAAGLFMLLGLVQFRLTKHHIPISAAPLPATRAANTLSGAPWMLPVSTGALLVTFVCIAVIWNHANWHIDTIRLVTFSSAAIGVITFGYFAILMTQGGLTNTERRQVLLILVLVFASIFFWSGFEQAGSSFNLFAQRYTDRHVFQWEIPASWFQSINSLLIIALAPAFAALWVRLGSRQLNPGTPWKFGIGLIQVGLGFAVLFYAARFVVQGERVAPTWLIVTYLLHSTGELCLSPVGLSTVAQLAPKRYATQLMGTWFMSIALGNALGGLIAGHLGQDSVDAMPGRFLMVSAGLIGVGFVLVLLSRRLSNLAKNDAAPTQ